MVNNIYSKIYDFNNYAPFGNLEIYDGKFYGMVYGNGYDKGSGGGIFKWDPITNNFAVIGGYGMSNSGPGSLTLKDGKFYGHYLTSSIFYWTFYILELDPVTNQSVIKYIFDFPNGNYPVGKLTEKDGKFYGLTYWGGLNSKGVIFEWDPASNVYTKKYDFNTSPNDNLTLAHAPVAKGLPGTCTNFPSITIDNSNNNQWVSITDTLGNAVAEIKANGNNLGVVTASMFINNAAVRQDGSKKLYLDRNITLTPQVHPSSPVNVRLYIKGTEYLALKNAVNSNGQPPGIDSINDISIYKVGSSYLPAVSMLTNSVVTTTAAWEADYVFSASISSFSSFYFAEKAVCTAPVITQVCASPSALWPPNHRMKNVTINYKVTGNCGPVSSWLTVTSDEQVNGTCHGDKSPDWIITDNHHLQLRAERARRGNGRVYTITIHAKNTAGNISTKKPTWWCHIIFHPIIQKVGITKKATLMTMEITLTKHLIVR